MEQNTFFRKIRNLCLQTSELQNITFSLSQTCWDTLYITHNNFVYFSGIQRTLQKSLKFCSICNFIWPIYKWFSIAIIIQFQHFRLRPAQLCFLNQCHYRIWLLINFTICGPKYLFSPKKYRKCIHDNWVKCQKSLQKPLCCKMEFLVCFGNLWKFPNWKLYSIIMDRY